MKWELDLWYELWDRAGSQGLDNWYELRNEVREDVKTNIARLSGIIDIESETELIHLEIPTLEPRFAGFTKQG